MDKYKVVLADDEAEVLNSIRRNIRWDELGFEIVGADGYPHAVHGRDGASEKREKEVSPHEAGDYLRLR